VLAFPLTLAGALIPVASSASFPPFVWHFVNGGIRGSLWIGNSGELPLAVCINGWSKSE